MTYLLKQAIRLGSLIVAMLIASHLAAQTPFSEKDAFLLFLKHDTVAYDVFTEEYVYRFQREKYFLIRDDEFEKRQAGRELSAQVEQISKNTVYTLEYPAEFGDYDFELQGFSFNAISENQTIKVLPTALASRFNTNITAGVQFANGAGLSLLPMEEEKANMLLKERKNYKNGKVDRSVNLKLYFTVDELVKTTITERRSTGNLICSLLKVEFMSNSDLSNTPMAVVTLIEDEELQEREKLLQAQKKALDKKKGTKAAQEANNNVISEVEKLLANSELSDELKATLIKSTIQYYEDKEAMTQQALYKPRDAEKE